MSLPASQIARRRQLIRELLRSERLHSQEELRKRLRHAGVRAEQATLSRDLHALGVVKGPDGYMLPEAPVTAAPARSELAQLLQVYLVSAEHTGALVVLRTGPGRAQPLALALDGARISGVLGTIAGDDTIFVALRGESAASRFSGLCQAIAGGRAPSARDFDVIGGNTAEGVVARIGGPGGRSSDRAPELSSPAAAPATRAEGGRS